jgi:hypothetical protein
MFCETSIEEIPQLDTSNGENFSRMFSSCHNLKSLPTLNLAKGKDFQQFLYGCHSLTEIPDLYMPNGINFSSPYGPFIYAPNCKKIGNLNMSSCTDFDGAIYYEYEYSLESLESLGELDVSSGEYFGEYFICAVNLTDFGGLKGVKRSFNLSRCPNLSHESLMNVINKLEEVTTDETVTLGSANLAKLSAEEKQIAINKGWILA